MLSSVGEANLLTLGNYSSAIALATEEAHFRHLRHFCSKRQLGVGYQDIGKVPAVGGG